MFGLFVLIAKNISYVWIRRCWDCSWIRMFYCDCWDIRPFVMVSVGRNQADMSQLRQCVFLGLRVLPRGWLTRGQCLHKRATRLYKLHALSGHNVCRPTELCWTCSLLYGMLNFNSVSYFPFNKSPQNTFVWFHHYFSENPSKLCLFMENIC